MTFQILKKLKTRLRVREHRIRPGGVIGTMVDAMKLPEGHAACGKCSGYKFEVSGYPGGSKVEMGCVGCGESFYIAFPVDVMIPEGRYFCRRHPKKAFIAIHNIDVVSFGCEACKTEINIDLKSSHGLVIAQ